MSALTNEAVGFFLPVLMVKCLLVLWGFSGFSGFLMVLMVWNVIPGRQSIRGAQTMISHQARQSMSGWERQRHREITHQYMYSKRVCVWGNVCVRACVMHVVQADNESYVSTISGHYRNIKPIPPPIFCIHQIAVISIYRLSEYTNPYMFIKTQITLSHTRINLHICRTF